MTPINKTYKRILWSILIGAIFREIIRDKSVKENHNYVGMWVIAIAAYIILTLIYNRYIWNTAKAPSEDVLDEEEPDFDWEEEKL